MAGTATIERSASASFGKALAAPFTAIGRFLVTLAEASPKMHQLNRLNRITDAELAEIGTTREDEIRRILGVSAYL